MKHTVVFLGFLFCLFLTGCATTRKVGTGSVGPMQNIYREGDILVTLDAQKEPALAEKILGSRELAKRCDRISASFTPKDAAYPFNTQNAVLTAVVEGDYPGFLVNVALGSNSAFAKAGDHFTHDALSVGSLSKETLLCTNGNWKERKDAFLLPPALDDLTAGRLSSVCIALYVRNPVSFFDLGFDIPQSVFKTIREISVGINEQHEADIMIKVESDEKASSLSKLLRSAYIADLRREKIAFSLEDLKKMFTLEGNMLTITNMKISDSQFSKMTENLGVLV